MSSDTATPTDVEHIAAFVIESTHLAAVPFVPEIVMHTAAEAIALWERTEQATGAVNSAPPFWAFPWAGGQGLARYVLDHPDLVRGRRVLDLASGGGLVAIAAMKAGAASVIANEIDAYADAAIALNAAANDVHLERVLGDLLADDTGADSITADVVLAGDVFYSKAMTDRMLAFIRRAAGGGSTVVVGDPGRAYAPTDVAVLATYDIPVIRDLEDADMKRVRVIGLSPSLGRGGVLSPGSPRFVT